MSCVLIHRYMCSNLYGIRASAGQGTSPFYRSHAGLNCFLSKIAPSITAPEAEGLPLNTPSKGVVDQACLINNDGCD